MRLATILVSLTLTLSLCASATADTEEFSLREIPAAALEPDSRDGYGEGPAGWQQVPPAGSSGGLTMKRAMLYSLLLPGLGEYQAGSTLRAKAFFALEAGIWTSFAVLRTQGHLREERYKNFAVQFAGITGTNHSDEYYKTIGQYDSSYDYETEFKAEGRVEIWPDVGYYALEAYYLENRISDFEEWAWSSFDRRVDYRAMRSSSRLSYRRSLYMVAAAAANRIASAVSVYQIYRTSRHETASRTGRFFLDFGPPDYYGRGDYTGAVTLIRTF